MSLSTAMPFFEEKPQEPASVDVIWRDTGACAAQSDAQCGFSGELIFYGGKEKKGARPILVEGTLVVDAFDESVGGQEGEARSKICFHPGAICHASRQERLGARIFRLASLGRCRRTAERDQPDRSVCAQDGQGGRRRAEPPSPARRKRRCKLRRRLPYTAWICRSGREQRAAHILPNAGLARGRGYPPIQNDHHHHPHAPGIRAASAHGRRPCVRANRLAPSTPANPRFAPAAAPKGMQASAASRQESPPAQQVGPASPSTSSLFQPRSTGFLPPRQRDLGGDMPPLTRDRAPMRPRPAEPQPPRELAPSAGIERQPASSLPIAPPA